MGNGEVAAGGATCPGSPRRPSPPPRGHHPVVERGSARWRGSELWGQPGRQGATRPPTLRLLWRGITAGISAGGERRALGQQLWVSFPPALPRESARPAPARMQPLCVSDQHSCMRATANPSAQHAVRQLPGRGAGGRDGAREHCGAAWAPPDLLTHRGSCLSREVCAPHLGAGRCTRLQGSLRILLLTAPFGHPLHIVLCSPALKQLQSHTDKCLRGRWQRYFIILTISLATS